VDHETHLQQLKNQIQKFCEERDWDQYHGAKDLAIGAVTEASELLEHFRFQTDDQVQAMLADPQKRQEVGEELADVMFFLLRFSQRFDFDLSECVQDKMQKNSRKYPAEEFRGKNHKSTRS
jgi:NTP pyrophosphatase (non-canonical NTP hydrolase)